MLTELLLFCCGTLFLPLCLAVLESFKVTWSQDLASPGSLLDRSILRPRSKHQKLWEWSPNSVVQQDPQVFHYM